MKFQTWRLTQAMMRHRWVTMIAVVVVAIFMIFFFSYLQSPDFPDDVPSYEQVKADVGRTEAQSQFFNRFTKAVRDIHGGVLMADEAPTYEELYLDQMKTSKMFVQKLAFFKEDKYHELANEFCASEKATLKIIDLPKDENGDETLLRLDFSIDNNPWVSVVLEYRGQGVADLTSNATSLDYLKTLNEAPTGNIRENGIPEPTIAIIIDDCGYRMDVFHDLVALDADITFSILPQLAYSEESALVASEAGREVMLHLPMQPKDWPEFDPGLGALMVHDSADQLESKMRINLSTVPGVIGVNNHMGSAFTIYAEGLDVVMRFLNENNLFFLDSKTAPGGTAKNSARKFDVPYLSRDVFLDNTKTVEATKAQLLKAARIAKRRGRVIAIGHLYRTTYEALAEGLPEIKEQGVTVQGISRFVKAN